MLSKTILIAIFVAVCFIKNSSQKYGPYRQCVDDKDFQKEIGKAPNGIAIIVVTNDAPAEINRRIKDQFPVTKKIQVNLDHNGDCHRTIEYLGVDRNVVTTVRMMNDNVLVPNVRVEMNGIFEEDRLNDAFTIAAAMKPKKDNPSIKMKEEIAHWFLQPMSGRRFPFQSSGLHPAPRGLPQVMPSFPGVIPMGQSAGSSMTDSQRAVWTPVFQQQPVQRVDSSLPQASASGSSAQLPQGQQRVVTASFRHEPQSIVPSDWLNLTMGSSASESSHPGSNATTSGQQSKRTASALRPVSTIQKQHGGGQGGGKSRGPK